MTNPALESSPTPTEFETEYKLVPLGDNFEARAYRAESIACAALAKLRHLNRGVIAPSGVEMRSVAPAINDALDPYRDSQYVEDRKRWDLAEIDAEVSDY